MDIRIDIPGADAAFRPDSIVRGTVELLSIEPIDLADVELHVTPPSGSPASGVKVEKLNLGMTLEGSTTFPLVIHLSNNQRADAGGKWSVAVVAHARNDHEYVQSTEIQVENEVEPHTDKGPILPVLLLAAGALCMALGIGQIPEIPLPEWAQWILFGSGFLTTYVAPYMFDSRRLHITAPFTARLIALLSLLAAVLAIHVATAQPDFNPLQPNFKLQDPGSILSIADNQTGHARLMGLLAGAIYMSIAAGLFSRRRVSPFLQAEIAFLTVAITCMPIFIGAFVNAVHMNSELLFPSTEIGIVGFLGLIDFFIVIKGRTWTEGPVVALLVGMIPLSIGVLYLITAPGTTLEILTAGLITAWGMLVVYLGGRNVLASRMSGQVEIVIAPNPVAIGKSLAVRVKASPHPDVRVDGATAELTCHQDERQWNGRTYFVVVHKDLSHVLTPVTISTGQEAIIDLSLPIPRIGPPTDNGSEEASWTLIVTAHFANRPDHSEEFNIDVTA